MKFEAATIKDIALALNLSTSTVSRALRHSYEVSSETRQLVLDCAARLNYHPNPIALSLKEKRSLSLGVVVCEIANSFFSQVINGIESIAYERGYNVIISQSHESHEKEEMNLQYLASRSVDGLLVSLSSESNDISYIRSLHDRGLPVVFFDRVAADIKTHQVIADNFTAAYNAVKHLVNNGYRRIANITNAPFLSITRERLAGYRQALEDSGIRIKENMIQYCDHGGLLYGEVEKAISACLKLNPLPDAIFASSDKLTTNSLRILKAKELRIPGDVALAGFSNSELTEFLSPSLTVIKQPAFEMGQVATNLLLQIIESKKPIKEFENKILQADLIIRASSARKKIARAQVI